MADIHTHSSFNLNIQKHHAKAEGRSTVKTVSTYTHRNPIPHFRRANHLNRGQDAGAVNLLNIGSIEPRAPGFRIDDTPINYAPDSEEMARQENDA